jgi:hypothetical protein
MDKLLTTKGTKNTKRLMNFVFFVDPKKILKRSGVHFRNSGCIIKHDHNAWDNIKSNNKFLCEPLRLGVLVAKENLAESLQKKNKVLIMLEISLACFVSAVALAPHTKPD